MDNEFESHLGTTDAKQLVEQGGDNVGNIAAVETSPGEIKSKSEISLPPSDIQYTTESHPIIEGLPVIGAQAENFSRKVDEDEPESIFKSGAVSMTETAKRAAETGQTVDEYLHSREWETVGKLSPDEAGTDAMIAELGRRADALVPNASTELKAAIREQAVANFRNELESKKAERQAAADAEAQATLNELKSGKSLDELEKEQIAPELQPTGEEETEY